MQMNSNLTMVWVQVLKGWLSYHLMFYGSLALQLFRRSCQIQDHQNQQIYLLQGIKDITIQKFNTKL